MAARCVTVRHSVPPVQYIVRAGGCRVAIDQWQSTGGSIQKCPGFDSWWLPLPRGSDLALSFTVCTLNFGFCV